MQEHSSSPYDRMQDILVQYAVLIIKYVSFISAGALVSIGAAIMNLIFSSDIIPEETFTYTKLSLATSFLIFSISVLTTSIALIFIYFSREFFLKDADTSKDEDAAKYQKKGEYCEKFAVAFIISSILSIFIGLVFLNIKIFNI